MKVQFLARIVALVEGSSATNGTPAARWAHKIQFTGGGNGGASVSGDTWTLMISGQSYSYPTSANGFANAVGGLAGLSSLTSAFTVTTPAPIRWV